MASEVLTPGPSSHPGSTASGERRELTAITGQAYEEYRARKHIPELDGLRAWSILLVIAVHMPNQAYWEWLAGRLGVTIFFVLSGYLITRLALREEAQRGTLSLGAFYIRRGFRIFPLYYLVLGIHCFYILVLGIHAEKAPQLYAALPYLSFYLQEVPCFFGVKGMHSGFPFTQSWSLGIEEKFYLIWPFLAFVCWRGKRLMRPLGTLGLAAFLAVVPALVAGPLANCIYPHSLILTGCVVALFLDNRSWFEWLRFLGTPFWSFLSAAVFLAFHFAKPHLPEFYWHFGDPLYAISIGLFLVSILLGNSLTGRVLSFRPLVFLGKISYGVYLIHLLCLALARRIVPEPADHVGMHLLLYFLTTALSVLAAYALALLVERPLIEVGRLWSAQVMGRTRTKDTVVPSGLPGGHCLTNGAPVSASNETNPAYLGLG
jgi:peptidoglycan/LPS O-acetylase OafA/YrhL